MIGASKIKNSLFAWLCALVVMLSLSGNCVGENFSYEWNESGKIKSSTTESTKENGFAYWYDASDYANAPKTTPLGLPAPTGTPYAGGVQRAFSQQSDQVYYRVFSGDNTAGSFLTAVPPRSSAFAQEALSLPRANGANFLQEVLVPAGTQLQRSRALPMRVADDIFPIRRGGAEQFELLQRIPLKNFGPGQPLK